MTGFGVSMLEFQLGLLRMQKANGRDVDDQIADTLIAMVKAAYVRGEVDIDHLERTVEAILGGEQVELLNPGERVLRGDH